MFWLSPETSPPLDEKDAQFLVDSNKKSMPDLQALIHDAINLASFTFKHQQGSKKAWQYLAWLMWSSKQFIAPMLGARYYIIRFVYRINVAMPDTLRGAIWSLNF